MSEVQPIKLAILAMGGEGGGVLANWIIDLAEADGWLAQSTSVPGVAQRTGATIYYVELFPQAVAEAAGASPVLALMPLPGDVDIVLASELMEAGRAVQRGLVTPERTTLVTSTHRVYAIAEKVVPGDGRASGEALLAHATAAARRLVAFDMAGMAERSGSVISAVLFGALAGTGVLPFGRARFEAAIAAGGVGGGASLKAFAAGFERAAAGEANAPAAAAGPAVPTAPPLATPRDPAVRALLDRARRDFGGAPPALAIEGLRRLVDYQDVDYAMLYLDRLTPLREFGDATLLEETARHLALWMTYEDSIRVADLKTRASRFDRVRSEVRAGADQLLVIEEFLHPRLEEIADTLPARWGRWLLASGAPRRWVERAVADGRTVRTSALPGFLLLSAVASLRRWRRGTLRFASEQQRIAEWLADIVATAAKDTALAIEIARCQRVVKGYGDTHDRGLAKFAVLRAAWRQAGADAGRLAALRAEALADESGLADSAAAGPGSAAPMGEPVPRRA